MTLLRERPEALNGQTPDFDRWLAELSELPKPADHAPEGSANYDTADLPAPVFEYPEPEAIQEPETPKRQRRPFFKKIGGAFLSLIGRNKQVEQTPEYSPPKAEHKTEPIHFPPRQPEIPLQQPYHHEDSSLARWMENPNHPLHALGNAGNIRTSQPYNDTDQAAFTWFTPTKPVGDPSDTVQLPLIKFDVQQNNRPTNTNDPVPWRVDFTNTEPPLPDVQFYDNQPEKPSEPAEEIKKPTAIGRAAVYGAKTDNNRSVDSGLVRSYNRYYDRQRLATELGALVGATKSQRTDEQIG